MRSTPAFTLIEILLVISILRLVLITAFSTFVTSSANQELVSSGQQLADRLRTAHIFAREAKDQKEWTIASIDSQTYALFSGTDEVEQFRLNNKVFFTNSFLVKFTIGTGMVEAQQEIELITPQKIKLKISILESGVIEMNT